MLFSVKFCQTEVSMKTVCKIDQCAGCMACVDSCPVNAIEIQDSLSAYNAVINESVCIDCGACHRVCPRETTTTAQSPVLWRQGWATDPKIRKGSSSGGAAAAITRAFIQDGGTVCSCVQKDGAFTFAFADTLEEAALFCGSRYVKSNPSGVYKTIRAKLKDGKKVLFIGLPCQVAALRNYTKDPENLYTADLICHGSPSPKVLDIFLKQYNCSSRDFASLQFRNKARFQIFGDGKGIITKGVNDRYTIAFLNGLCYTEGCYSCPYAQKDRVSDLTLGDSWGSLLPENEQKNGISLLLCQTEKGKQLMDSAAMELTQVDPQIAIDNNHQLHAPSPKPQGWDMFYAQLKNGASFNKLVKKLFPKSCFRQDVKQLLIKLGVVHR